MPAPPSAIVLAAGKGTRMGGEQPKVLYEVAGRPMVHWVLEACRRAGAKRMVVVVGFEADRVREALADEDGVEFVLQEQQLGTGHAVRMAEPAYADRPAADVFVVAGDMPLLKGSTLAALLAAHRGAGAVASLATGMLDDPTGYGRIVRDAEGGFAEIVEQKDATEAQKAIREVNPSCYCFRSDGLFDLLRLLNTDNAQGEYYITDVLGLAKSAGQTVEVVQAVGADEVEGINTPDQLARVDAMLRGRLGDRGAAVAESEAAT